MSLETIEAAFLEHSEFVTLFDLAERSGLSEGELRDLIECGVLSAVDPSAVSFESRSIVVARTAYRLREELALDDTHALAIVLRLIQRIEMLQDALRVERARR